MRRSTRFRIALALTVACAAALSACGGEDAQLLPGETAREIDANLDTVQRLADEGDCVGAESAVQQVSEQVEGLRGVDPKLKRALERAAAHLGEVVVECEEVEEEATSEEAVEPEEEVEEEPEAGERGGKPQREAPAGQRPEAPETAPERSDRGEERSGGREGSGGGGGGGGETGGGEAGGGAGGGETGGEESPSGGVGPGSEAGAAE